MIDTRYVFAAICFVVTVSSFADDAAQARQYSLTQTDETISISDARGTVLVYNKTAPALPRGMDSIYARDAFLHPVNSPSGRTVTDLYPADHPHQNGIFCAWVNTRYDGRKIDFWNLHRRQGRVVHDRVLSTFENDDGVGFEVALIHRITEKPVVDVLAERWKVTVRPSVQSLRCFDIDIHQTALTDISLVVNKYKYGGMAVRGAGTELPRDKVSGQAEANKKPVGKMVTDSGRDRLAGNHSVARWVSLTSGTNANPVTITLMSHPENFRSPQRVRLHPTMPYFCFAPCVDEQFAIDKQHPYSGRYRVIVADGQPNNTLLQSNRTPEPL